jgi:hypothetical protein
MNVHLNSKRLQEIAFVFPDRERSEKEWSRTLGALLMGIPGYQAPSFLPGPENALPVTTFRTAAVGFPAIVLHTSTPIKASFGKLSIWSEIQFRERKGLLDTEVVDIDVINSANPKALSITALYSRLNGHLVDIDHTGVNIPVSLFGKAEWEMLKRSVSAISNLYRYPDEEWPFIIPANEEEFLNDITVFAERRIPKFEWVYDQYASLPMLQFALVTDFSREELEAAFPGPYGFSIHGLELIFRSVIIDSPWSEHLVIRMDLYYRRNEEKPTDWETGEWLVKAGGRVK